MAPRRAVMVCLLIAAGMASGCGDETPLANVSGQVTFHGVPTRAEIIFTPTDVRSGSAGRPSTAFSDENGEFALLYDGERRGAVIGQHNVVIRILPMPGSEQPASYEDATGEVKRVQLIRNVEPGANRFNFVITF